MCVIRSVFCLSSGLHSDTRKRSSSRTHGSPYGSSTVDDSLSDTGVNRTPIELTKSSRLAASTAAEATEVTAAVISVSLMLSASSSSTSASLSSLSAEPTSGVLSVTSPVNSSTGAATAAAAAAAEATATAAVDVELSGVVCSILPCMSTMLPNGVAGVVESIGACGTASRALAAVDVVALAAKSSAAAAAAVVEPLLPVDVDDVFRADMVLAAGLANTVNDVPPFTFFFFVSAPPPPAIIFNRRTSPPTLRSSANCGSRMNSNSTISRSASSAVWHSSSLSLPSKHMRKQLSITSHTLSFVSTLPSGFSISVRSTCTIFISTTPSAA